VVVTFTTRGREVGDGLGIAVEQQGGAVGAALARRAVAPDIEHGRGHLGEQLLEARANLDR